MTGAQLYILFCLRPYICRQYATPCSPISSIKPTMSNLQSPTFSLHSPQYPVYTCSLQAPFSSTSYPVFSLFTSIQSSLAFNFQHSTSSIQPPTQVFTFQPTVYSLHLAAFSLQSPAYSLQFQYSAFSLQFLRSPATISKSNIEFCCTS